MKKTFLALAVLAASAFSALAAGVDTYSRSDFRPHASDKTHVLKLKHPLTFGKESWTLRFRAKIGQGFYMDKDKNSWGSSVIAAGDNAFPGHFDYKPFQLLVTIANSRDSQHVWGGIPKLNAQGNPTIDGITYVIGNEETRDGKQPPKAGESWQFTIKYNAANHTLSSFAFNEDNEPAQKSIKRKSVADLGEDFRIDSLSTSVIGLEGWRLGTVTVNRGNVKESNTMVNSLLIFSGIAGVIALVIFGSSLRRREDED